MGRVAPGKRAGSRRASRSTATVEKASVGYAAGVTFSVIAWGYLVFAAIDFGTAARNGNGAAWALLTLAALGAAACLFAGLMFGTRLVASLGLTRTDPEGNPTAPRPTGGRRAAR